MVPFIVAHWEMQGKIIPIKELLRKVEQLPELTSDPLLPEIMIKFSVTKSPNPLTIAYNIAQSVFSKIISLSLADNNNTSDPHEQEKHSP